MSALVWLVAYLCFVGLSAVGFLRHNARTLDDRGRMPAAGVVLWSLVWPVTGAAFLLYALVWKVARAVRS